MTKHKRNGKAIHLRTLAPSRPAEIELGILLEGNFLSLCSMYQRTKGFPLVPPQCLNVDMLRWRTMRWRHKRGDFRHTESEMKSVRAIAQWTVDVKNELAGQPPNQIEWMDE